MSGTRSRPPRSAQLADALRRSILAGEYRPDDRLPSERRLAAELGVGRSTVRRAFDRLAKLGLVDIRHGGGARVRSLDRASLERVQHLLRAAGRPDRELTVQTLEVAEVLVRAAARLAVERGDPAALAAARRHLAAARRPDLDDAGYFAAERAFVRELEAASGNLVLCLLRNGLSAVLGPGARARLGAALRPPVEFFESVAKQLDRALEARDADAVEDGIRRLLADRGQRLLAFVETVSVGSG